LIKPPLASKLAAKNKVMKSGGCGNCVVTCESNAIQLKKKDTEQPPPKTMDDMYTRILMKKVGKLNMLKIGAKMLLKLKV